jgi:hypothetical protein
MLVKRDLFDNFGNVIGEYYVSTEDDRIITTDDGEPVDYKKLHVDDQNRLDNYIDAFEEGFNQVTDGEEWHEVGGFRISRPAYNVKVF